MTLNQSATGIAKLIGVAYVLLLIIFPFTLFVPLLKTKVFVIHDEISLVRAVYDLFHVDIILFTIVFVFGVVFPFVKILASLYIWYVASADRAMVWLKGTWMLSKLSMMDIFLFALFIVAFKGTGLGHVQIKHGLYLYMGVVISSVILSLALEHAIRRHHETACGRQSR